MKAFKGLFGKRRNSNDELSCADPSSPPPSPSPTDHLSPCSPSSPAATEVFSGHMSAMEYKEGVFKGTLMLLQPLSNESGAVLGEEPPQWMQGESYPIVWDVTGNFPHVEIRLRSSSGTWVSIAARIQAGRQQIQYTVPSSVEPGQYTLRISARPRSKIKKIRSEAIVHVQRSMKEFAEPVARLLRAQTFEEVPPHRPAEVLDRLTLKGPWGSIPLHVFALFSKHVYETEKNVLAPEDFPFWDRWNELAPTVFFSKDAENAHWCSAQRERYPVLQEYRGPGPEFAGFTMVESHTSKHTLAKFEGLKVQAYRRPAVEESQGDLYVVVFRGTTNKMDILMDAQVFNAGNADMYVNLGMEFVANLIKRFDMGPRQLCMTGHSLGATVAAEVANAYGTPAVAFALPMLSGDRANYQDLVVCNVIGDPIVTAFMGTYNRLLPECDVLLQYPYAFASPGKLHSSERLARQIMLLHQAAQQQPEDKSTEAPSAATPLDTKTLEVADYSENTSCPKGPMVL